MGSGEGVSGVTDTAGVLQVEPGLDSNLKICVFEGEEWALWESFEETEQMAWWV